MSFNSIVLGAGAALALTMFSGAALAQTVDDTVARDACAPRYQVLDAGTYVGCSVQAQPEVDISGLPPALMVPTGDDGQFGFMSPENAVRAFGREGALLIVSETEQACEDIGDPGFLRSLWRNFIRPGLRIALTLYGADEFGTAYGILFGGSQAIGEVDQRFYEQDVEEHRRLMRAYCGVMINYQDRYGDSLVPADESHH